MRKRFAPLAAQILVLGAAACATTPPAAAPPPAAETPAAGPSGLAAALARAGSPDAPTLAAVQHAFGPADIERREGAGAILTYRLEGCALVLVFAADSQNQFRLAEVSAQPARGDDPAPALAECAAAAQARTGTS